MRSIVDAGHVRLVETLAERIAEACLADRRVHLARVRVEKLDIFADATSAGVEIERRQRDLSTSLKPAQQGNSGMAECVNSDCKFRLKAFSNFNSLAIA